MTSDQATFMLGLPTAIGGVLLLVGLFYRFVMLPQLRRDLIQPVQETHRQVTTNHHTSKERTVLDRLTDLETKIEDGNTETTELRGEVNELRSDMTVFVVRFGEHLSASERESERLWSAIQDQRGHKH